MMKRLFLAILCACSTHAMEEGVDLLGNKKYLDAVKVLLTQTKTNDVRVPQFIHHLSTNQLFDPNDLEDNLRQNFSERLEHLPFVPTILGMGSAYLEIVLNVQKLYDSSTTLSEQPNIFNRLEGICKTNKIGFGYSEIARFLERTSKLTEKNIKKIILFYEKGAQYADVSSIMGLGRFSETNEQRKLKLKINPIYLQEYKFLKSRKDNLGEREKELSILYLKNSRTEYGFFKLDKERIAFWQVQSAQKGNVEMQFKLINHSAEILNAMGLPPMDKNDTNYWVYFAAVGGLPEAQAQVASYFYEPSSEQLFEGFYCDPSKTLMNAERAIATFEKDPAKKTSTYYQNALRLAAIILDKGIANIPINEQKALKYYKAAADLFDDPEAAFNAASMIENNRGIKSIPFLVEQYWQKASAKGDYPASGMLWLRYFHGSHGFTKSIPLAYKYLVHAAQGGDPESLYNLYGMHAHKLLEVEADAYPIEQDFNQAIGYLKQSAAGGWHEAQRDWILSINDYHTLSQDDGNLFAQCVQSTYTDHQHIKEILAGMYARGYRDIIPTDEARAFSLFEKIAEEYSSELANHNLGYAYEYGIWGQKQSYKKAFNFYKRNPSFGPSLCNLGFLYERGKSVKKDIPTALEHYHLALEKNCGAAANNIAVLYQEGKGVKKNHAEALFYYQKGWELGDQDAGYQYAKYLYEGKHFSKDWNKAVSILSQLDLTDPKNTYALAVHFLSVSPDFALSMIKECAETGFSIAQYTYGLWLYLNGASIGDTALWLQRAADQGMPQANSALRILQRIAHFSGKSDITVSLLAGKIDESRSMMQTFIKENKQEDMEDEIDNSLMRHTNKIIKQDAQVVEKRKEDQLEYFLDPMNRKSITVENLQKLTASFIKNQGGYMKPTSGSGRSIRVGNQTLGFHEMHRSGQSSRATLDPGRVKSFQQFIKNVK